MKVKILNLWGAVISRALAYISLHKLRCLAGGDKCLWLKELYSVALVLCQDLVQHKMRNFNYFQLTNRDSLATLAL